jgi:hypothetical protein
MTSVSSLESAPLSREGPSAKAAQTSARLVRLLDPGGWMLASKGSLVGDTENELATTAREIKRDVTERLPSLAGDPGTT